VYFVRRKGRIKGPLALEKLRALRDEDRLRMRDEIAESADGPWKRLTEVYLELFGDDEPGYDDASAIEDEFWAPLPSAARSRDTTPAAAKPAPSQGLFPSHLKPWQWAVVGITAAGLALLAVIAGIFLSPVGTTPTDPNEIAANANEATPGRRPQPRPRTAKPATTAAADSTPTAATDRQEAAMRSPAPGRPQAEAAPQAGPDPARSPSPATSSASAEAAAPEQPAGRPVDPVEGITKALTAYYAAGNWQDRYRTAVQGDEVREKMRQLYEDVDWVSVQWTVAQMPTADQLASLGRRGERVRIDTLTNGHPHSIYMIFSDGRWRVDWLHSLNTLWLTK